MLNEKAETRLTRPYDSRSTYPTRLDMGSTSAGQYATLDCRFVKQTTAGVKAQMFSSRVEDPRDCLVSEILIKP